jgi:hypothetical protein
MSKSRKPFTTFVLDNAWNVEFPTEPAGVLRLGPGKVQVQARLSERHRAEDGWFTVLDCELRIADAAGKVWQATGTFYSGWLLYPLIDLARKEPGRWLRNAPEEWRTALAERSLIQNVSHTYDDRFYRYVWIDNTAFCLQFKYLGASFAIAALSDDQIIVQVGELFCSWNPLVAAGPDGNPLPVHPLSLFESARRRQSDEEFEEEVDRLEALGEFGDYEHIQPLAYTIDAGRLLFRNTVPPDNNEDWEDQGLDRPLVFRRTRSRGEAQRIVSFHAKVRLTPSVRPPLDEDSGFVLAKPDYSPMLDLLTDAGGILHVDDNALHSAVKLDRHPGATGTEDVLRCRLRLTDEAGDIWEAVTVFTPEVFFEKLEDLDDIHLRDFEVADAPWQPGEGSVLGVRSHLDGGWRYLLLYHDMIAFRTDDQHLLVDVSPTATGFEVRITGLVGRRRPVKNEDHYTELDPEDRAAEVSAWDHDQPLPGIRYSISLLDLCFRNTTFAVDEGFWHGNAIPIPVVFTRVGKGEPNPGIRFVPDEETP